MAAKPRSPRSTWSFVVPVVAAGAGLLFGVSATTSKGTDLRPGTTSLVQVVQDANRRVAAQQSHVNQLRGEVQSLTRRNAATPGAQELRAYTSRADAYALPAGLTPVSGRGVEVTMDDSDRTLQQLPADGNVDWLVVHQQDVQAVVNALWQSGASAIKLMDQRVISTSAVRCVGNTLILQGRVYSPPFTITAIGDPAALERGLRQNPGVQDYRSRVDLAGVHYDTRTVTARLPAYGGSLGLDHARPKE